MIHNKTWSENVDFWMQKLNTDFRQIKENKELEKETNNISLRKENFRKLHEHVTKDNEDVMNIYYDIHENKNKAVRIDEITLDRVLNKHGKNGMINISANRSDEPKERNILATKELISDLKKSGFSYLPTYGGYRGKNGVEDNYEPSFIVFNYKESGENANFEELYNFALYLCGKYEQDSVLIKAPDAAPIYVDSQGNKVNKRESNVFWKNDPSKEYFTSFKSKNDVDKEIREKLMGKYKSYCHKNNIPLSKNGFEKYYNENLNNIGKIGKRYTYDITFECYVNPMPCQLVERMRRKGEIMIWE